MYWFWKCSRRYRIPLRQKRAEIKVDKLPTIPVNPILIRPLFYNLISNAIKYSKKDVPPVVQISSEITHSGNGAGNGSPSTHCRIFVKDNGIGFEQKYAEQIFQMFKRLHLHSEFEGTGIGLALCKKIVEKHHGHIFAQSTPGEGSLFTISLPLKQPQNAPPAPPGAILSTSQQQG